MPIQREVGDWLGCNKAGGGGRAGIEAGRGSGPEEDSPSRKMLKGEVNRARRDPKRREHNLDRLGSHLSNLAGTHSEFLRADVLAVSHPDAQDD
jgi:hypothetical protein